MKKLFCLVMVLTLALSLAACASNDTPTPAANGGAEANDAAETNDGDSAADPEDAADDAAEPAGDTGNGELITVGFAQCKADESNWRMANTSSMQEALSADNGFNMILADANNNAAKQVADVQGFIDQEVDYIVIAAVNMDGWDTVLANAADAGIPVILVDRTINASEDLYTCWVGSDFKAEGVKATDWIATRFGDGDQVNIVNLQGQLGSSAQAGRTEALEDAVAANDNWNLAAQQTGDWSTYTAKEIMASWIQQHGESINVVYAENDNMADGVIQALEEAGIAVGETTAWPSSPSTPTGPICK